MGHDDLGAPDSPKLLAYVSPKADIGAISGLADGLVLPQAQRERRPSDSGLLVIDLERYKPVRQTASFSDVAHHVAPDLGLQIDAGADVLLAPGVLTPRGDISAFRFGLDEAQRAIEQCDCAGRPVYATVLVTSTWLVDHGDEIVEAIAESSLPVAVVLAGGYDALSTESVVATYVELIRSARTGFIALRCDVSAIGAMCAGASYGTVGTHSGTRHLWIGGGGASSPPRVTALSLRTMTWLDVTLFDRLDQREIEDCFFVCPCDVCAGRSILRLADPAYELEITRHNVAAAAYLARNLIALPTHARFDAWLQRCRQAVEAHREFQDEHGIDLAVPKSITAWSKVPVPAR